MTDEQSTSSAALKRMKAAAEARSAPANPVAEPRTSAPSGSSAPVEAAPTGEPAPQTTRPAPPASQPTRPPSSGTRLRHARLEEQQDTRTQVNRWLDSLSGPDWDEVSDAIYESPARTREALKQARERREETQRRRAEEKERLAAERARAEEEQAEREARARAQAEAERREAERLEAERAREEQLRREAEAILEQQRAEEQALREEMEREEAAAALVRQQERETAALRQAAREEDGSDHVPPAHRRPMLQQPGEDLTDAQLLARARESLPEWRRRDRIVEKAQAIETATLRHTQPAPVAAPVAESAPRAYIPPYNLPSTEPDPEPTSRDLLRRTVVTLTWAGFVVAGMWSLGMLGERPMLHQLADGRYGSDVSMLSMASWHLAIWPLLWLYLGVHVVHQWLPSQASADRQRTTGWRLSAAMAGVGLWLLLTRLGLAWFDVFVWLAIGYLLVDAVHQLNLYTARTQTERVITDGAIGLFAGWSIVYTATVISTWLQRAGVDILWIPGSLWAVLTLVVVIWGTAMLTMTERGRITIALGLAWGLAAILGTRLIGPMQSVWVAIVAAMGAFIILLATENRRYRINHAEHRAALGHEVEDF
ncbi:hypothetical protein [Micrococcus terreus]|uniref:hypothetical protein n=1 Tax=Micrococcus terreus TaxID=574650 RepID=UPI003D73D194